MPREKLNVGQIFGGGEGAEAAPPAERAAAPARAARAPAPKKTAKAKPTKAKAPPQQARPAPARTAGASALAEGIGRGVGRPKRDTEPYTFRLPPDLHRKFDAITRGMGKRPMSGYVEEWVEKFVEDNADFLPPALR